MPITSCGPLGAPGDLVDVERGGVGGEDRAGLGDCIELAEDVLLDVHPLEYRFDDDVGVARRLEFVDGLMSAMRLSMSSCFSRPLDTVRGVVLPDDRRGPARAASCVMSISVTGMPALAKLMAMPPPMVPAPITAAFFTRARGVSSGTSGIFEVCALGEEHVAQRLRLGAVDEAREAVALDSCGLRRTAASTAASSAGDDLERCRVAPRFLRHLLAHLREEAFGSPSSLAFRSRMRCSGFLRDELLA